MDDLSKYAGRYKNAIGNGQAIITEAPGKGFMAMPYVFPDYIGALGINPTEFMIASWLLRHSWFEEGIVYPSIRKFSRNSRISESTLRKHLGGLEQKGYINRIDIKTPITDRRIRRSVVGILSALEFSVLCNPRSNYCKSYPQENAFSLIPNSPEEFELFTTPKSVNNYYVKRGYIFDWAELIPIIPTKEQKQRYECLCIECENIFLAGNRNAKRCHACKQRFHAQRFENFLAQEAEMEKMLIDGFERINI